jgi:predicted ATP-grasp superfamily ATP-dependent carboligase
VSAELPPSRTGADPGARPAVLLTNAEERSMLAACRSLQRAGYDVGAASSTRLAPAQWSRACRWRERVVDPRRDASGFVAQLRVALTRRPYATLIAGSDSALLAISRERERLSDLTTLGLPAHAIVERALSRTQLARATAAVGLTAIDSIRCAGADEALAAARSLGFPVVLKSIDAALGDAKTVSGAPKGRLVHSEAELRHEAGDFHDGLLVQPVVRGEPISFAGVVAGGRLRAVAVARYLRMWPVAGGSVTFAETIPVAPALERQVGALLAEIGWEGIFELELIGTRAREAADFVPIDLNPRPYGSMALATAAGAPLAAVWCDWLLRGADGVGDRPVRARAGVRYRWEDGDLRHLAWQLRHRDLRAALQPLRPYRAVAHAHFRRGDPLPLGARVAYLSKRALGAR